MTLFFGIVALAFGVLSVWLLMRPCRSCRRWAEYADGRDDALFRAMERITQLAVENRSLQEAVEVAREQASRVAELTAECERRSEKIAMLEFKLESVTRLKDGYRSLWREVTGDPNGISVEELVQRKIMAQAADIGEIGDVGDDDDEPTPCTGSRLYSVTNRG